MTNQSKNNFDLPDDDQYLDSFFNQIEKEFSSIELQEYVNGLTTEDLEEKGFIGDKDIEINRNIEHDRRKEIGINIGKNIKYIDKKGIRISDILFESVADLPDVMPNEIVARLEINKNDEKNPVISILQNKEYLNDSNIDIRTEKETVTFISKIKGKLVLFNDFPYVIASDIDGYCKIRISNDKMTVYADIFPPRGEGKFISFEEFINQLKKNNVVSGIKEEIIRQYIDEMKNTGSELNNILVAEGSQPVNGKDAFIEYFYQKENLHQDFTILPDGRIDYHTKANIPVVMKGALLARITDATNGTDGFDVTGKILKAVDGVVPVLVAGENVSLSKDKKEFVAECDGQVVLNDKIINVFQCFYVEGDVDYRSGNIDFNGNVIIKGVVREGFEVKATGDITVMKDVESANVVSGRDLIVYGGIICRGNNYKMICGRDLIVSHLQNATVEVQRDIIIGNSCVQSNVYCNGKMIIKKQKGTIIGGIVYAMEGIEAKNIGTDFGAKTEVVVGNDYLLQKTANELKKIIEIYVENQKKIDTVLLPFINKIKNNIAIAMDKKDRLSIIVQKRKKIIKNISMLEYKLKHVESQISTNVSAIIKVNETIFADVVVRIRDRSKKIIEKMNHVCFYYDEKNKEITTRPY